MPERVLRYLQIWRERTARQVPQMPSETGGREQHGTTFKLPQEALAILESSDLKTLTTLERVARRWDEVYSIQEGEDGEGDFYPKSIGGGDKAKSQLRKATQRDPQILNPRTNVREDHDGNLISVPMTQEYGQIIREKAIVKLLESASDKMRGRDPQFRNYLRLLALWLKETDFTESERLRQEAERLWLTRQDEPKIDLVLGFHDTNTDALLGTKYAAEAWLTVLDEKATADAQKFGNVFCTTWNEMSHEKAPIVKIRVGWEKFIAGQAAKFDWSADTLPCEPEVRQQHGSKCTLFKTRFERTLKNIARDYKLIVHPEKRRRIARTLLRFATLREYIGHEVSHSITATSDFETRFQNQGPWLKELDCESLCLDIYNNIPDIGGQEKMAAVIGVLLRGVDDYRTYIEGHKREPYFIACSIILNFLLTKGSLQLKDGLLTWKNSRAVLKNIHDLSQAVRQLVKSGEVAEAQRFLDENFDENLYPHILYREPKIPDFLRKSDPPSDPNTNFPDPDPDPAIGGSRPQPKKSPSTN